MKTRALVCWLQIKVAGLVTSRSVPLERSQHTSARFFGGGPFKVW